MREVAPVGEFEIRRRHIFFTPSRPVDEEEEVMLRVAPTYALFVSVEDVDRDGEASGTVLGREAVKMKKQHGGVYPDRQTKRFHTPLDPRCEAIAGD